MMDGEEWKMIEDLEKIYADVSEWLKFAEAKHAAALALWTALIVAVISVDLSSGINFKCYCVMLLIFIFGMMLNVISFIPFLNRAKKLGDWCYKKISKKRNATNNLVFYQNIFLISGSPALDFNIRIDKYKDKLKLKYSTMSRDTLLDSYIEQIVSVSTVATIKIFLFDLVAHYILCLVFAAFICIIIA